MLDYRSTGVQDRISRVAINKKQQCAGFRMADGGAPKNFAVQIAIPHSTYRKFSTYRMFSTYTVCIRIGDGTLRFKPRRALTFCNSDISAFGGGLQAQNQSYAHVWILNIENMLCDFGVYYG